jgi:hypothetical protein
LEEPEGNNDDVFENPGLGKGEFAKHRIYLLSNPEQATARAWQRKPKRIGKCLKRALAQRVRSPCLGVPTMFARARKP